MYVPGFTMFLFLIVKNLALNKIARNLPQLGMLKVENFFLDTGNFFPGLDENSRPRDDEWTSISNYRRGLGYS